jgi:hypothetical protein
VRIAVKDQANACTLFTPRVTVAREASSVQPNMNGLRLPIAGANAPPPRNANDARDAFDRLFKK